jgi:hypothetical protein
MGSFRFWHRISIVPGVRLNLSKSGVSVSVGKRGANLTLGKKGPRVTVGLPGTGLSYTETFKGKRGKTEEDVSDSPPRPTYSPPASTYTRHETHFESSNGTQTRVSSSTRSRDEGEEEEQPNGCLVLVTAIIIIASYLWWTGWFD